MENEITKRILTAVCALILTLSCCLLTACKKKNPGSPITLSETELVGSWTVVKAEMLDKEANLEDAVEGGQLVITLNEDKTASLLTKNESGTGTWSLEDGKLSFEVDSYFMEFMQSDKYLVTDLLGLTMYFEKK